MGFTSTFFTPAFYAPLRALFARLYSPRFARGAPSPRAICRISPFAYRENGVFAVPSDDLRRGQAATSPVFISKRGIGSISPALKLWGLTAGGGITLGTDAAPQGARKVLETISLLLETMKPNSWARSHGLALMPPRKGSHREVLETISLLLETMKPNSGARSHGLALMPHRKVLETISLLLETMKPNSGARSYGLA